jgi:hypothetical protein
MKIYNNGRTILLLLHFNCNVNLKQFIALTLRNMPAGLYFVLKYFSVTLLHTSLITTLSHNDTMLFHTTLITTLFHNDKMLLHTSLITTLFHNDTMLLHTSLITTLFHNDTMLLHTSLITTLFHNDTMHSVPSMSFQPSSTAFIFKSLPNIKITVILGIGPSILLGWYQSFGTKLFLRLLDVSRRRQTHLNRTDKLGTLESGKKI